MQTINTYYMLYNIKMGMKQDQIFFLTGDTCKLEIYKTSIKLCPSFKSRCIPYFEYTVKPVF